MYHYKLHVKVKIDLTETTPTNWESTYSINLHHNNPWGYHNIAPLLPTGTPVLVVPHNHPPIEYHNTPQRDTTINPLVTRGVTSGIPLGKLWYTSSRPVVFPVGESLGFKKQYHWYTTISPLVTSGVTSGILLGDLWYTNGCPMVSPIGVPLVYHGQPHRCTIGSSQWYTTGYSFHKP